MITTRHQVEVNNREDTFRRNLNSDHLAPPTLACTGSPQSQTGSHQSFCWTGILYVSVAVLWLVFIIAIISIMKRSYVPYGCFSPKACSTRDPFAWVQRHRMPQSYVCKVTSQPLTMDASNAPPRTALKTHLHIIILSPELKCLKSSKHINATFAPSNPQTDSPLTPPSELRQYTS